MGIEKVGLPAKPAAKGSTWVLDASSCQSCQTPFTLFNRKHHCRRCGGLFCGNCSSARVNLRGQGDSPVRVCEPCKKLEEAARFQARHRGKHSKGVLKGSSVADDDALMKDALGDDMHSLLSGGNSFADGENNGVPGSTEMSPSKDKAVELKNENTSPEKLREQAVEQKRIYSTLKREGKNAEALQAFKRHKELGREADALELSIKKLALSQRRAHTEGHASAGGPAIKPIKESSETAKDMGLRGAEEVNDPSLSVARGRKPSTDGGDEDLLKALKDLGWKDSELSEKKVKKGPTSDMELLAEISDSAPKEASLNKLVKQNPTQLEILAHKRQALLLKREGKPVEAKEELKKAKMLERKLEEMTIFGDDDEDEDDDNDELAALMRNLDKEAKVGKGKDMSFPASGGDIPLSFSLAEDDDDTNVDVTDDDINDPSMIAALRSMGWVEEAAAMERSRAPETGGPEAFHIAESVTEQSSLQREILNHKRRAVTLKREGKVAEAKIELQEAKVLEQKLELLKSQPIHTSGSNATAVSKVRGGSKGTGITSLEEVLKDSDDGVEVDEDDMRDPEMMAALKAMGFEEESAPPLQNIVQPSPLEKKNLQDEILSIKRSALALKKQGKIVEAREELRQAKLLEQKLQKIQLDLEAKGLPSVVTTAIKPPRDAQIRMSALPLTGFVSEDEEEEVEVSADDFMDPDLVAALKSVGWQEEDTFAKDEKPEQETAASAPDSPPVPVQPYKAVKLPQKEQTRKLQLQKELLAHKRRALALKREGKMEEAKLELSKGKVLEKEMEAIDNAALGASEDIPQSKQNVPALPIAIGEESEEDEDVTDADMHDPELLNALKAFGWKPEPEMSAVGRDSHSLPTPIGVDKRGSVKKAQDTGHKLDVHNPPYTKTPTKPPSDPIWHAIMRSASKRDNELQDIVTDKATRAGFAQGESLFEGEHAEKESSKGTVPPQPPSGTDSAMAGSGQGHTFDLLSGGAWEAPAENGPKENDSDEDEDDVFDSGLLAALQSIGLSPSSKDTSLKQVQGDAENVKGQRDPKRIEEASTVVSRGGNEKGPVSVRNAKAEAVVSSSSGRKASLGNAGSYLIPPDPMKPTSSNDDVTVISQDAAGARVKSPALVPDTPEATTPTIQEDIKMHKRKALALKREGKSSEAREELRQAKILEKQLEMGTRLLPEEHQSPDSGFKASGTPSSISPEKLNQTVAPVKSQATPSHAQTHKEQMRQEVRQGKDRMKLQQESLAHKRKALGLRREGKIDEAEADNELAKILEKQMEDLDEGTRPGQVALGPGDMGMVEDLLDPHLMAALQGLGWNDGDLHGGAKVSRASAITPSLIKVNQPPNSQAGKSYESGAPSTSSTNVHRKNAIESSQDSQSRGGSTSGTAPIHKVQEDGSIKGGTAAAKPQAERKQLEDRIKYEKLKALELKRAGRQGEALEALRGAKRLEKELLSMAV